VCEYLATNAIFDQGRLYSVNVPVKKGVSEQRVVWTRMLQNQWKRGACFEEVESASMVGGPDAEEANIRRRESDAGVEQNDEGGEGAATPVGTEWKQRHFKWAPRFTDVFESVERAGPGSDGWAVQHGETSVTGLRANFMHVEGMEGEVKL
jgi:broad specificity polyphosphatase/5'/3'-nucleotidase SurE